MNSHDKRYWLLKSEPSVFGIDDLAACPDQSTHWDGVRNYQARNMLRDQMKKGDLAFFYHSNCKQPGIVGLMEIIRQGYPDHTAFDPRSKYHDPKSSPEKPRWYMVDIKLVKKFEQPVSLTELKRHPQLENMLLLKKGNRLSVLPISPDHWDFILSLTQAK